MESLVDMPTYTHSQVTKITLIDFPNKWYYTIWM